MTPEQAMFAAFKEQMPSIRTQAQLNAFMASFEALRGVLTAIFTGNKIGEAEARKGLEMSFDVARQATEISDKLRDVPEAATSAAAEDFKKPPAEFVEYDVQRALLSELEHLATIAEFSEWYATNRGRLEQVKSASLRNVLFDAIREKKAALIGVNPPSWSS